jgi:adenylate kinase
MIILMGVAGSGKSTQADLLSKKTGYPRLGVGDLLRAHMGGEEAKRMLDGEMLDDNKVLPLFDEELNKLGGKEFILDGSPRSMRQAEWWASKAKNHQLNITAVIHLRASEETAKNRLLARHRPDDHEPAIAERFAEYHSTIEPILDYLSKQGFKIHEIDAERPPEAIEVDIEKALGLDK